MLNGSEQLFSGNQMSHETIIWICFTLTVAVIFFDFLLGLINLKRKEQNIKKGLKPNDNNTG